MGIREVDKIDVPTVGWSEPFTICVGDIYKLTSGIILITRIIYKSNEFTTIKSNNGRGDFYQVIGINLRKDNLDDIIEEIEKDQHSFVRIVRLVDTTFRVIEEVKCENGIILPMKPPVFTAINTTRHRNIVKFKKELERLDGEGLRG